MKIGEIILGMLLLDLIVAFVNYRNFYDTYIVGQHWSQPEAQIFFFMPYVIIFVIGIALAVYFIRNRVTDECV